MNPFRYCFHVAVICVLLNMTLAVAHASERLHVDRSTQAARLVLAQDGQPMLPIVLPTQAGEDVLLAANELASSLKHLTGATFEIKRSDDLDRGIVLAKVSDLPGFDPGSTWTVPAPQRIDPRQYLIRTEPQRLLLAGMDDYGVCHAVYDLLHRLGYRWYFPQPLWSHVPEPVKQLEVQIDVQHRPDYFEFYLGAAHHNRQWNWRNRNHPIRNQFWTHRLGHIVLDSKDTLAAHPEYRSEPVKGKGRAPSWWLCLSQPGARQMVAEYVLAYFRKYPDRQGFSLEPADGDGWCRCDACAKRSYSDWLVMLANETAAMLEKEFPDKQLGFLAYNRHSPPPTIAIHKQVWVFPTNGFNQSGNSFEQQLRDWSRMTLNPYLGMYDYWNFSTWHAALPQPRGGQIPLIRKSMREAYDLSVRHFATECIGGWAHCGLAYYVANELSWNLDADVDAIIDDFCRHMFPEAALPMRAFYNTLNVDKHYWSDQFTGQLFTYLNQARALTADPDANRRLDQLTLYAVYLDQFRQWRIGRVSDTAFMQFLWKCMNSDALFEADQLWQWLPSRYRVTRPAEANINVPVDQNPWKTHERFSHQDLMKLTQQGLERYPVQDIPHATFSTNLVPLEIGQKPLRRLGLTNATRFYLYTNAQGRLPVITASGPGTWTLLDHAGNQVATGQVPDDKQSHELALEAPAAGLYRLEGSDLPKMKLQWPAGSKVSISVDHWTGPGGNRWHYFYVPKGTQRVAMYMAGEQQHIYDGSDTRVYDAAKQQRQSNFVVIDVPQGQDGSIWRLHGYEISRRIEFLNIPPYLALSPDELLVPREVMGND